MPLSKELPLFDPCRRAATLARGKIPHLPWSGMGVAKLGRREKKERGGLFVFELTKLSARDGKLPSEKEKHCSIRLLSRHRFTRSGGTDRCKVVS